MEIKNISSLLIKGLWKTEMQGTCVPQLIVLMDVSIIALSVLTTLDNGWQQWLCNSLILLLAHLWSNATQLIMNLREIRPLSNICQLDVSAAFNTTCLQVSTLYHIIWRQELFSHFLSLLTLFFPLWGFSHSCMWSIKTYALIKLQWM